MQISSSEFLPSSEMQDPPTRRWLVTLSLASSALISRTRTVLFFLISICMLIKFLKKFACCTVFFYIFLR
ncbi:hypothetical protein CEXT_635121 [Caerostris extrusa]|uniref:Uncharacterized protein n=1 Tax=Caerostris extrusa TaxID=172846 RepID=A0AAV4UNX8_CAEEX|nr:hypothetical protein CEXT_635121 [Caerostris extrusa]